MTTEFINGFTSSPYGFTSSPYPRHAKELPRPKSPLQAWYKGSEPKGTYIDEHSGVVTSKSTSA